MAKADLVVKVSVERAIHAGLQKALQQIWDDHGVCVTDICADWQDVSSVGKPKMVLTGLDMRSSTKA